MACVEIWWDCTIKKEEAFVLQSVQLSNKKFCWLIIVHGAFPRGYETMDAGSLLTRC